MFRISDYVERVYWKSTLGVGLLQPQWYAIATNRYPESQVTPIAAKTEPPGWRIQHLPALPDETR